MVSDTHILPGWPPLDRRRGLKLSQHFNASLWAPTGGNPNGYPNFADPWLKFEDTELGSLVTFKETHLYVCCRSPCGFALWPWTISAKL